MVVYMKFYCLKNKNGNYSIRAKLDGIMTEFARFSKREMAANAEVWLPNKDNRRKSVQSKGFLSLNEELKSVLRKWLGSYVPVLTSKVVALSPEDADMLVENTVTEIITNIGERGARWNNNIRQQYEDKLKKYQKEPQEQLTIDDIES